MKETGPTNDLWEVAEHFFDAHPNEKWFKKKSGKISQSVIRSGKELYAIGEVIGQGLTSKVKDLLSKTGVKAVAKYTGGVGKEVVFVDKKTKLKGVDSEISLFEKTVLERLGLLLGFVEITFENEKKLINEDKYPKCNLGTFDVYSKKRAIYIMPKFEGRELVDLLNELPQDLSVLTDEEFLLWDKIALGCAKALLAVHQKDVIHGDLKTDQFIVNIIDNKVDIYLIDFGCSIPLSGNETHRLKTPNKDPIYASPEAQAGEFHKASDIFSLGKIFEEFPTDDEMLTLIDQMCKQNPDDRKTLSGIVGFFEDKVATLELTSPLKNQLNIN
ncbi:MAG: protein kinase family protein [Candidatus Berkiella sp.]